MDSLELSVQNHSEFNHICQKLKLILKEQRDKIRENDSIAAEKENIVKKINLLKVNNYYLLNVLNISFNKFNIINYRK